MSDATSPSCPACNKVIDRKGATGPLPTYCSTSCRAKASYQRRKAAGTLRRKRVTKAPRSRTCAQCGGEFESVRARRCCSKRCETNHYRATRTTTCTEPGCDKREYAKGQCRGCYKRTRNLDRYEITCIICEAAHLSARRDGRFCSLACRDVSRTGRGPTSELPSDHPVRVLLRGAPGEHCVLPATHPAATKPRLFVAGACVWCDAAFTVVWQTQARYCSSRCSRQATEARHGRFSIPTKRRLAIYERDNWTCQLCLEPVDQDLMSLDPVNDWAPSLDHIECQSWALIPDHSDSNLRLAHRWCNAVRGDGSYYSEADLRAAA